MSDRDLTALLKRAFGYDRFRPLQREMIDSSLAGRDVVGILPTGAGKSLCFQLPALVRDGLTLVVSPLIALMKDQVDALDAAGIPATFLNSSLHAAESRKRREGLLRGKYKLLYAAPERVMLDGFAADLLEWKTTAIAIDEAHCISEWGHDFRPEYRQLAALRGSLPGVPWTALTATATTRVREDIITQLGLRDPEVFLGSFNRPNLAYSIILKEKAAKQVVDAVRQHTPESGIVYVQSRKTAESMAASLSAAGILALPYHAGLDAGVRAANQEAFLRDEVRVICATIAFGMGINKPDVRFVIHADLPKNIESYYQETGRAGRDGLPADCLLLYSRGDLVRNLKFLGESVDPVAARIATRQIRQMADFAEGDECRRAALLEYFGEKWEEENCGGCDICLQPRDTRDATTAAQMLLSCVLRIFRAGGFSTGLNHVVEVLCGADTARIRKWSHHQLSTYGIGKELPRAEWLSLGRQLIRLGYLQASDDQFQTLSVTETGLAALKNREPVLLAKAIVPAQASGRSSKSARSGAIACDEALFSELRALRKRIADERGVPPYVVFGDLTLRHIARSYPCSEAEFLKVPGVGSRKLAEFGATFLAAVASWLETHKPMRF